LNIRGVFFDFFGTLVVPANLNLKWSEWYPSVYSLYEKNGIKIPHDNFLIICETFWSSKYNDHCSGYTLFEKRLLSQIESYGITTSRSQIKTLADEVSEAWFEEHYLDREAADLLKFFKDNGKTALITNFDHPPLIRLMLERYNIAEYFDSVIISGDIGVKKPEPEIFLPALAETGLSHNDVIYVGDSIMDFRAALHAGILPIIIRREGQHDPKGPGNVEAVYEKTDAILNELSLAGQIDIISKLSEVKTAIIKHS